MKYRVKVLKTIKAEETEIGAGATILLRCTSKPIIKLLRQKYNEENTCLIGDIRFLFSFDGIGLSDEERYFQSM